MNKPTRSLLRSRLRRQILYLTSTRHTCLQARYRSLLVRAWETSLMVSSLFLKKKFLSIFLLNTFFLLSRRFRWKYTLWRKLIEKNTSSTFSDFFTTKNLRSCKFSYVRSILTFDILNWLRNPHCQFYLSFSKIDSRFLWKNVWAKCAIWKKRQIHSFIHLFYIHWRLNMFLKNLTIYSNWNISLNLTKINCRRQTWVLKLD